MNQTYARIAYWVTKILRKSNQGAIFVEALNSLGEDVSPIYNELGCVETINTIVQRATGSQVGGGASSYNMYNVLMQSPTKWKQVKYPQAGDIVISPTGYGNGNLSNGHVGIVGINSKIMSNNSSNSLLEENYTITKWANRYVGIGGFPMKYFRAK